MQYKKIRMQIHVLSQELLSAKVVAVSSLPFFSDCKVAVIRGVFHQKASRVIIPIGAEKSPSSTLQCYAE